MTFLLLYLLKVVNLKECVLKTKGRKKTVVSLFSPNCLLRKGGWGGPFGSLLQAQFLNRKTDRNWIQIQTQRKISCPPPKEFLAKSLGKKKKKKKEKAE